MMVLRPGQRVVNIPGDAVSVSRRAVSAAAGNGLLNALIAYWPLNEAGGANDALDAHSNGLTFSQASSPGSNTGKVYATARTFDGSADCFLRASGTALQTGDVDFTVVAWVYLSAKTNAQQAIFGRWSTDGKREYELSWLKSSDRFIWQCSPDGTANTLLSANTFGAPNLDAWCLVTAWHDAVNNVTGIAVNNGAADTTAFATGVYAGTATTGLAAYFNSGTTVNSAVLFAGRIGPVAMWKSAAGGGGVLTAAQRTALFNGGAGLAYAQFTT